MFLKLTAVSLFAFTTLTLAQNRPPQAAPPPPAAVNGAVPIRGVTQAELAAFTNAVTTFTEVDSVPTGLGPRFNMNSCAGCHAHPSPGAPVPPSTRRSPSPLHSAPSTPSRPSSPRTALSAPRASCAIPMAHPMEAFTISSSSPAVPTPPAARSPRPISPPPPLRTTSRSASPRRYSDSVSWKPSRTPPSSRRNRQRAAQSPTRHRRP